MFAAYLNLMERQTEAADHQSELLAELKSETPFPLDKVKKDGQLLDAKYLLYLINFIGVKAQQRFQSAKKKFDEERRAAFKNKDDKAYIKCVAAIAQLKEQTTTLILKEVTGLIGVQEEEVMKSLQAYARNPQFASIIQYAQEGKLKQVTQPPKMESTPTLTKQKVLEYLEVTIK